MSRLTRFLRQVRDRKGIGPVDVAAILPVFYPSSANFQGAPELTYQAANRFPELLWRLCGDLGLGLEAGPIEHTAFLGGTPESASHLGALMERRGSDKTANGYHSVYAKILDRLGRDAPLCVLEIGLGTNDPHAISTMGAGGTPGASLRAFRDYLPRARIFGADIDRNILFQEDRIATGFVDQTRPETFSDMHAAFRAPAFDLLIDDGLHSVEANLNTLRFALSVGKPGSWIVIEDIPARTLLVWRVVAMLLRQGGLECHLVSTPRAFLCVVQLAGGNVGYPS